MSNSGRPIETRMSAGIALLRRTGSMSFQLRFSDDEDPIVWMAVGEWRIGEDGRPAREGKTHYEVAAAMTPPAAVMRLLDQMIDGGTCPQCERVTSVLHDAAGVRPLGRITCVWGYDAELELYVRSCDGKKAAG